MEAIVYIDRSEIRTADRGALHEAVDYGIWVDDDASEMTVVAVHPDSASLARHLSIGAGEFRSVGRHIDLRRIDVYGHVSDAVAEQLRDKARQLGTDATVAVHEATRAFSRL